MNTYTYHLHIDVSLYDKEQIKSIMFKSNLIVKLFDSKIIETRRLSEIVDNKIIYVIIIKTGYAEARELEKIIKNIVQSMLLLYDFDLQLYLEPIKINK